MKKHFLKTMTIFGIAALGISAVAVILSNKSLGIKAEDTPHSWNHYAAVTPTESTAGNKEYWVCCAHKEVVFTTPTEGTVTEAANPDFAGVEAGTENNAAYLSNVKNNTFNIGYTKMSKTGAEEETWEHVEGFNTILEDVDVVALPVDSFGSNFATKNGTDTIGGSAIEGAWKHVLDSNNIALPKVNYSLYEYVKYSYGIDTWGSASLAASFGFDDAKSDLHPSSTTKTGVLEVTVQEGKLRVADSASSISVVVDDNDVLNGKKSLTLKGASVDAGRTFFLNAIYTKAVGHVHNYKNPVPASDRFGRNISVCSCGASQYVPGDNVTEFSSASIMGASGSFLSDEPTGQWKAVAPATGTIGYAYGNPAPSKIVLPKIDFKTSGRTELKFSTTLTNDSGDSDRFELKYNGVVLHDMAKHGNNYNMTMNAYYVESRNRVELTSSIDDGTVFETVIINDQDVINGNKSLEFDFRLNGTTSYQVLGLNTILCNHSHSGNVYKNRTDLIGYKNVFCSVCGAHTGSSSLVTETSEIDVANHLYGASIKCVEREVGRCSIANVNGAIKFVFGDLNNPEHYELEFPRVQFVAYSKVVFNMQETEGWVGFGFTVDQSNSNTCKSGRNAQVCKIEVTRVSSDEATAVFTYTGSEGGSDNYTSTITLSDYDVMHGVKGMQFFGRSPFDNTENRILNIQSIEVTPYEA